VASVLVTATDLTRRYGQGEATVHALAGVTVGFPAGQFTAIMGPSGSGKSTLMHLLAGLDRPTSGSVVLDGTELSKLDDKRLTDVRRDKVGFIFQSFNLLPVLSAQENIELPLSIAGRKPDRAWMDSLIATVGLGDRLRHRPAELSGGQQQRVAGGARARLAPQGRLRRRADGQPGLQDLREVLELLRRCVDEFGQTIVMVTHDARAASYADRLLELEDGVVVRDGVPAGV
jgi:putative ABC transport system ATP-binding protein